MPISGEFYLVKIGSVWLTDDGTETGKACLTKVDNLARLFSGREGATQIPLSGKPYNFTRERSGNNVKLICKPFAVTATKLAAIQVLLDAADLAGTAVAVAISDGPGAVNMDCDPLWEGEIPPITFSGDFYNDDMYNVEIRLITRGFTAP
jgi:hypothetical protein